MHDKMCLTSAAKPIHETHAIKSQRHEYEWLIVEIELFEYGFYSSQFYLNKLCILRVEWMYLYVEKRNLFLIATLW